VGGQETEDQFQPTIPKENTTENGGGQTRTINASLIVTKRQEQVYTFCKKESQQKGDVRTLAPGFTNVTKKEKYEGGKDKVPVKENLEPCKTTGHKVVEKKKT